MTQMLPKLLPLEPVTTGIAEVCNMTGMHGRMVRRLIAEGTLKSVRVGGRRLVFLDSVRLLLKTGE